MVGNFEHVRHIKTKEYIQLAMEAYEKFPEDKYKRLNYVKERGTKQDYLIYLLCILQSWACGNGCRLDLFEEDMRFNSCNIGGLFKALSLAVDYMKDDLPDEVYNYIIGKLSYYCEVALKDNFDFKY